MVCISALIVQTQSTRTDSHIITRRYMSLPYPTSPHLTPLHFTSPHLASPHVTPHASHHIILRLLHQGCPRYSPPGVEFRNLEEPDPVWIRQNRRTPVNPLNLLRAPATHCDPLHPIPITRFRSFRTQPLENLRAAVKLPIKKSVWATQHLDKSCEGKYCDGNWV